MTVTPELVAAIGSIIISIFGAFYGFNKWLINRFLKELRPNGGHSLKDQVNRLEQRIDDIYHILAERRKDG